MTTSRQETYYSIYRNRQSWFYHLAYMRISKVFALLYALEQKNIDMRGRAIFDYGFGSGTFFRHCPKDCRLAGVELDQVNVDLVTEGLHDAGYANVDLQVVAEELCTEHVLLNDRYDIIIISHVLEHLKQPEAVLRRLLGCLTPEGVLNAAVPINELVAHENHERVVNKALVEEWAAAVDAEIVGYWEIDQLTYRALPVFEKKSRVGRLAAQSLSLGLGIITLLLGRAGWLRLCAFFGAATNSKPAQAVFLFKARKPLTSDGK